MFTILENLASILLDVAYFGAKYYFHFINHEMRLINPIFFSSKYAIYGGELLLIITIIVRIFMSIWLFKLRNIYTEEEIN